MRRVNDMTEISTYQVENDMATSNLEVKKGIAIPYGWNPTGETIYSVIYKLKVFNRLTARDTREFFQLIVEHRKLHHGEWFRSDFDVDLIIERTGWPSTHLDASFPDYLFCYDKRFQQDASVRGGKLLFSELSLSKTLRICPTCYKSGLHLIFHQSTRWNKCPIHNEDLKTTCTKCGTDTNQFINTGSFEKIYRCANCGYDPFTQKSLPREYSGKLETCNEYKNWCSLISKTINRKSNTFLALSYNKRSDSFSDYIRLLSPPKWIINNTEKDTQKAVHYLIPYSGKLESITNLINIRDHSLSTRNSQLNCKIADIETYFKNQLAETRDLFRDTLLTDMTYKLEDSFNSVVGTTLTILDNDIDSILDSSFTKGSFWRAWHSGPGNRLGLRVRNSKIVTVNINFTKCASRIWLRSVLLTCFKRFLGCQDRDKYSTPIAYYINSYAISAADQEYVLTELEDNQVTSLENSTEIHLPRYGSPLVDLADLLREVKSARKTLKALSKHASYLQQLR